MTHHAPDWVHHHADRHPTRSALRDADTGEVLTWADLDERTDRACAWLTGELALRRGDRVGLLADSRPAVLVLQFACLRSGLIFSPYNWRLPVAELEYIARDSGPSVLVHDGTWAAPANELTAAAEIPRTLYLDRLAEPPPTPGGPTGGNPLDQVCQLLYTSGTTGFPKGAMVTFGNLIWQSLNTSQADGYALPGCHLYTTLPLFHAGGLNTAANPTLYYGGTVTTSARFDPATALDIISDKTRAVTHLGMPPVMYQAMADVPGFDEQDLSHLRMAAIAGGIAPAALLRRYRDRGVRLKPHYGGTEMGPDLMLLDEHEHETELAEAGSVGRPVMHTRVRLVTAEGREARDDEPGEVWISGPSVSPGYWPDNRSGHTEDGWFRTGDIARRDERGFYFLVDRVKDMYKSGGENIYPAEIERLLIAHDAIAEAAVIGVPNQRWGEVGLALVVPTQGAQVTTDTLREALCDGLARYKHPHHLEIVDDLPRNVTGKVAKNVLRERYGGSRTA